MLNGLKITLKIIIKRKSQQGVGGKMWFMDFKNSRQTTWIGGQGETKPGTGGGGEIESKGLSTIFWIGFLLLTILSIFYFLIFLLCGVSLSLKKREIVEWKGGGPWGKNFCFVSKGIDGDCTKLNLNSTNGLNKLSFN